MSLPSRIPRYDSVDLIELDHFPEHIIVSPEGARLPATWEKAEETDRRLVMFEWALHVVRRIVGNRLLIRDFASAFLLSFEATLQILREEHLRPRHKHLEPWLQLQDSYDVVCKGLRTLRTLEAHFRAGGLAVSGRHAHSWFASGSDPGYTAAWHFTAISIEEFEQMDRPKLSRAENMEWGEIASTRLANELMRHACQRLRSIVLAAEIEAGEAYP